MRVIFVIVTLLTGFAPTAQADRCFCARCVFGQAELFRFSENSMTPSYGVGDCIVLENDTRLGLSDRLTYGDIIAFLDGKNTLPLIKRIVGLPGDIVAVVDGVPVVNGVALSQKTVGVWSSSDAACTNAGSQIKETLACNAVERTETTVTDVAYSILDWRVSKSGDRMKKVTVPNRSYFVVGDHREISLDSRQPKDIGGLGFVSVFKIVGYKHGAAK